MSDLFSWSESGYAFLVGMAPKEVESSVDHIRRHMTSFYPRTDDVHFDHLVRWRHFIPVLVTSTLITWSGDVVLSQNWWCPLWSLGQVTSFYPSTGDVHFDPLVLHWKVTVSPSWLLSISWEDTLRLSCSASDPHPAFYIHWGFLSGSVFPMITNWWWESLWFSLLGLP